jgi:hypothetical protein
MGLVDAFGKEDRVEITVSQLIQTLTSNANLKARNDILLTGFKKHIDYDTVLALLNEENQNTNGEEG